MINGTLLYIALTNTYPFHAGVVRVMMNEFKSSLVVVIGYFLVYLMIRLYGAVRLYQSHNRISFEYLNMLSSYFSIVGGHHAIFGPPLIQCSTAFLELVFASTRLHEHGLRDL
jgi:hypothetical protein